MSGSRRRLTIASLVLALGLAGARPAIGATDSGLGGLLGLTGPGGTVSEDVNDGNLLGGLLGGTGELLGGLLGGLGAGPRPDLSIQPVPTGGGGGLLEGSTVVGGLLDGLLGLGSLSESLAGRL